MKDFFKEVKEDFWDVVSEFGFFPALFIHSILIPLYLLCFLCYPFVLFNDWSKGWFKNETNRKSKM